MGRVLEVTKGIVDFRNGVTIENVKPDDVQAIVSNAFAARKMN